VLVVDSDPAFGSSLVEEFRSRGFQVESAWSPEEALARVATAPPDLVVLDLYLAGGAALNLIRAWKVQQPDLVVILVSGNASLNVVVNALKEGARRFFTKPISAAALLDELQERRSAQPHLSALAADDHQLGSALNAEGVARFFAISPGLMSIAGFDGYFKMLNPAWEAVLGYTVDELCARPYLELVHPDDREKASDEALEISGGETVFRFKNRYRCKDGSYRWLAWSATPSPAHELIYASARDVTKSVLMEQGLRQSNERLKRAAVSHDVLMRESTDKNETLEELGRFKDEVAAMIVHDLKSPLSVIVWNYDYVLEGYEGSADCLEALQDSRNAARRMLRLLANLVDVARLEKGILEVHPAEVSLQKLLPPVAEQRRVLARAQQISVVVVPGPEITIAVDSDLLLRTVENIFDNAFRHTPAGGSIEMEVCPAGADTEIRIGNSGPAVPLGSRSAIFEKYRHTGSAVGRMNLGLGLYFCRLAIEAQGGGIWVEETERLPAVFVIRLPRDAAGASRGAAPEAARAIS
jgi:PAS domain S-box-containing protein